MKAGEVLAGICESGDIPTPFGYIGLPDFSVGEKPVEDMKYRGRLSAGFPSYSEALASGSSEEAITYAFIHDLETRGLEVVPRQHSFMRRNYNHEGNDPVGYRLGSRIEYATDVKGMPIRPETQRAILGHEYMHGTSADEFVVFEGTKELFKDAGDMEALLEVLRIGNPATWRN